jgi:mannose-6-phosphate isomerase-like protein (cupin superfamily)
MKEAAMVNVRNVLQSFSEVRDHWSPLVLGRVNDQFLKIAKLLGQLTWHKHDDEDELFYVVRGQLRIQFEGDRETVMNEGDFCVVPRGTLHNPVADEECWIVLIETVTTKHTGDVVHPKTRSIEEQLGAP